MEQSETQLHDVKKLNPVSLKLKSSRLEELEEFFKLSEAVGKEKEFEQSTEIDCEPTTVHSEQTTVHNTIDTVNAVNSFNAVNAVNAITANTIDTIVVNASIEDSDDDFFADYE